MKPKLSLILPAIRRERWKGVYDSVNQSFHGDWELIIVGPYPLPPEMQLPNVKYIADWGSPMRCQQLGWLAAEGEYITWGSDDGLYRPNSLDESFRILGTVNFDPLVAIEAFYTEGGPSSIWGTIMDAHHLWFHRDMSDFQVPREYMLFCAPVIHRRPLEAIGGWDCRFETYIAMTDLSIRLQNYGVKGIIQTTILADFGHMPDRTGDHAPMHDAFLDNDMPLLRRIYLGPEGVNRVKINPENWKQSPAKWARRFGA
jgi:hypothetical protein